MKIPKALRYAAEPVFLFYVFGLMIHQPVLQQYVYKRISDSRGFHYEFQGTSSGCSVNATMRSIQKQVQEFASKFQIGISLFNSIPSVIACLFLGAWSDRIGRKPVIVLGLFGSVLETSIILLTMHLKLPVWVLFIGAIFNGIGGYFTGLSMAVMSYIADITDVEKRAIRLGIMEAVVFVGAMLSNFVGGHFINAYGFVPPMWFVFTCLVMSVLYAIFVLPESLPKASRGEGKGLGKVCFSYPVQVWRTLTRERPGKWKLKLMIPADLFTNMLTMGMGPVILLYLLNNPFCLTSIRVGYFTGTRFLLIGLGTGFGLKVLSKFLTDYHMMMVGFASHAVFFSTIGLAKVEWLLYVACVLGLISGITGPILRGIMSKSVDETEQGSLFSAVASLEMLFTFIGTFVFNSIYPKLNERDAPGVIFFLNVILLIIPLSLTIAYTFKIRKEGPYQPSDAQKIPIGSDGEQDADIAI